MPSRIVHFCALLFCAWLFSLSITAVRATEERPKRQKAVAILAAQAITAFRTGEFLRAVELYRQLTTINPADGLSWQLLGQSLAATNDPRAAKQAYLKSLEVRPDGPVAAATKELLATVPAPDAKTVMVDDSLTLADWLPLAEDLVRQGKALYVLERNGKILAAQGALPQIDALQERLVREQLAPMPLTDLDGARKSLDIIRLVKPMVPGNLTVLRYEGMACHMLGKFECAETAYSKWLQQAGHSEADRGLVSRLLMQARQRSGLEAGEEVVKLGVVVLAMPASDAISEGAKRLWVQAVVAGQAGDRLGLQAGDAILKLGDKPVVSASVLKAWSETLKAGTGGVLEIERDGKSFMLGLAPTKEELAVIGDEAFRQFFAGKCEPAIARLQELVIFQPDDALPWLLLGQCRQTEKDVSGAREAYARALQLGKETKIGIEAKEKLATMPQPDPFKVKLASGLTLGDWINLQRSQSELAKPEALLDEARSYLYRYGPLPALVALEKVLTDRTQDEARREVEMALKKIRIRNVAEAELALPQLVRLKAIKPDLPALLRMEARTCHMIKFYSCAEEAYSEWLLAAPAEDPRRRSIVDSLFAAQQKKPLPETIVATGQTLQHCRDCPSLIVIGAGTFDMGEPGQGVAVRFDRPFAIGRTEVTQAQWGQLMGGNPSEFKKCGGDCPVENVSWSDAQEYVRRLAAATGKPYRLPSEAEWEAACRAGDDSEYCGGDNPGEVGRASCRERV